MSFPRLFKAASFCLISSGFVAITAAGIVTWISAIMFSAVLIFSWIVDSTRIERSVAGRILKFLAPGCIPLFIIDYTLLTRSFENAVFHLILFVAAIKLLTLSKDRDYLLLYVISFTQLLAAASRTVDPVFTACFLVFLFSAIASMILFEMRRSNARLQKEARVHPVIVPRELHGTGMELFSPFPAKTLLVACAGITLLILFISIPLFFLLPRVTLGSYRQPSGKTLMTSGFSERVELGHIGTIKQSDAVVMRVKTDKSFEELPHDIKWRGLAFDFYDGRAWTRSEQARNPIPTQGWYYKLENYTQRANLTNQTFFVEALSTNAVFASHRVLAVSRDVGRLRYDTLGNLYTSGHALNKLKYTAISDTIIPDASEMSDLRPIPEEVLRVYTRVPPVDPRIARLARQVTEKAANRYEKALMLEHYLRSTYEYSLVLRGTPKSADPLAMFLFDVRKGHCEYFASALAIMLRQLGIPSRLVNGFRRGEYNSIGESWTVRQYDAHSWVEAYFPPYGWIEFDPTPPEPRRPRNALSRLLYDLSDAANLWWWENIVNYDSASQHRAVAAFLGRLDNFNNHIRGIAALAHGKVQSGARALATGWIIPLTIVAIAAAAMLAIRPMRRLIVKPIRRRLIRENPRSLAIDFYEEAITLLGSKGMKLVRGQTPLEFAHGLRGHPAANAFLALTVMYNEARFARRDIRIRAREAEALLNALRESLSAGASRLDTIYR